MAMISRFDIGSDFTLFFLVFTVLLVAFGILLTRVAPKKPRGRQKFDDQIVDRNRELID